MLVQSQQNAAIAAFADHNEAEIAVKALQQGGFDMKQLSIVGANYQSDEHVIGYYNTGDRMKAWGKTGAFWGSMWGLILGAAFFTVPGIGALVIAGPLVAAIVSALEGGIVVGGLSALGAGLMGVGIPHNSVVRYETDIKAGKYLVVAHGSLADVERAKDILSQANVQVPEIHALAAA